MLLCFFGRRYLIRTLTAREARERIWVVPRKVAEITTDRAERIRVGRSVTE